MERSISLLSFPYKIEKSLYLVLLKRNFFTRICETRLEK
nr:MAG TPA: hypothetical protein [Caudoviricetes sp.]